jgi:hypothetical protein
MSTLPPLSHHEILQHVAPFARRGHVLDLASTDRAERRIVFKAVAHKRGAGDGAAAAPSATDAPEAFVEQIALEVLEGDRLRLVRTLDTPEGLQARLDIEGSDAEALLEQLQTVPPARQFLQAADRMIALRHRLAPLSRGASPTLVLRTAQAGLRGLGLEATLSSVSGYPLEFELVREAGATLAPPDDLLAVLGAGWDRLVPIGRGWRGAASVRGAEPARTPAAEARLVEAVAHLARTLAAPPADFHARHRGARWRVALRGTPPVLFGAGLVVAAILIQRYWPERASWIGLLANMAPPVLMALFFMRREMPRIGLPRVPRCPPATAWGAPRSPDPTPAAATTAATR